MDLLIWSVWRSGKPSSDMSSKRAHASVLHRKWQITKSTFLSNEILAPVNSYVARQGKFTGPVLIYSCQLAEILTFDWPNVRWRNGSPIKEPALNWASDVTANFKPANDIESTRNNRRAATEDLVQISSTTSPQVPMDPTCHQRRQFSRTFQQCPSRAAAISFRTM